MMTVNSWRKRLSFFVVIDRYVAIYNRPWLTWNLTKPFSKVGIWIMVYSIHSHSHNHSINKEMQCSIKKFTERPSWCWFLVYGTFVTIFFVERPFIPNYFRRTNMISILPFTKELSDCKRNTTCIFIMLQVILCIKI
jgi:hypothetical protein